MKKFALTAVAALALAAFTSCDEYTLPNPPAQSNEAEALFNASDLKVTPEVPSTLNLTALSEQGTEPEVLSFTVENLPAGRVVKYLMQMSDTEDFAKVAEVTPTTGEDNVVRVNPADIQEAYFTTFTHDPAAVKMYVRFAAYISNTAGTENARVGGPDNWYASTELTLMPMAHDWVMEDSYYFVGTFNNWQAASAIPLIRSGEGNIYDNPDFYLPFQVSGEEATAGYRWAIVPASSIAKGNLENGFGRSNDNQTLEGRLAQVEDVVTNGVSVPTGGTYMLKINMFTLDYTVSYAYESLYVNAVGYQTQYPKMLRLFTNDYVNYDGVVRTRSTFRLACEPSNNGMFYGGADGDTPVTSNGVTSGLMGVYSGIGECPAMTVPNNGFYYVQANIKDLTWKASQLESISVVGSFNGWNTADAAATMTPDRNMVVYTINNVVLDAGGEFKFCCNHDWAISFGGAMDDIVQNGGNLAVPEAGTYDIKLDFTTIPYSVTLTKK